MELKRFNVNNNFALSDGSCILAVADITDVDIDPNILWELIIDDKFISTLRIVDELKLRNQSKRKLERALVVKGDLEKIDWSLVGQAYIRQSASQELC